tara:strand:- start:399 stop:785 length:387 start_codon:yes stop_codon:yes gene_type:complete
MKSYQDILNEKSEGPSLSKIVEDFIKEYNIKGKELWGDSIDVCSTDSGTCFMVSDVLDDYLKDLGISSKLETIKINKKFHVVIGKEMNKSHTAVLVGNDIIDLTARQFGMEFPYPWITSKSNWKKRLK